MKSLRKPTYDELVQQNRQLEEEVHVARRAADITARLVVEQFSRMLDIQTELKELNLMFKQRSSIDGLTNLPNRRYFEEVFAREWRRCRRNGCSVAVLMLDIDNFKEYNDHYGHIEGDECLKKIARCLEWQTRRGGDLVARFGGEEFIVILGDSTITDAANFAEQLRQNLEEAAIPHAASRVNNVVTASIGAAAMIPEDEDSAALISAADRALYRAKEAGRNRVVADIPLSRIAAG